MYFKKIAVCVVFYPLVSCGGTVIGGFNPDNVNVVSTGGPAMQYFLPRGEVDVTASFEKGVLTSGVGDKPKISADIDKGPLYLSYSHEGISTENVTIAVGSNGLLQKVSSTSSSQLLQAIQGANEILKQYTAFKAAGAAGTEGGKEAGKPPNVDLAAACEGLSISSTLPVVGGSFEKSSVQTAGTLRCKMTVRAVFTAHDFRVPVRNPPVPKVNQPITQACEGFVCFRPQTAFTAVVQTSLSASSTDPNIKGVSRTEPARTVSFLAPDMRYLGYIRFDRGVFAERTIEADFTDGILTTYSAKHSSELVGFLAVPAAALTTATLIRALN